MLTALFFDTETNGLPSDRNALTSDTVKWPHIVQLSWSLSKYEDNTWTLLSTATHYVCLPSEVPWNTGSAAIHKIPEATARSGAAAREVLKEFQEAAAKADVIVAHNLAFDKPVLRAALYRLNSTESFSWWPTLEYCTMEHTKALCKLPTKFAKPSDPWKYPRLVELYKYLFNKEANRDALHTASGDVAVLITCFEELLARRVVPFDTWLTNLRVRRLALAKASKLD